MSVSFLMASKKRAASLTALALSGALVLSACSDDEGSGNDSSSVESTESAESTEPSESTDGESSSEEAADAAAESNEDAPVQKNASTSTGDDELKFDDAYAATEESDRGMSAVYGTLRNVTDRDMVITEVKGNQEGARYELHTVDSNGNMKELSGFKFPAGKEGVFKPGGNHIMILDLPEELAAGDTINLTLVEDDGTEHKMDSIPVRVQGTSHEHYGDGGSGDMNHMQHGEEHGHEH